MLRGYRSILAALAGLAALLVAYGVGLFQGTLDYPDEERHQPYRYATDKPAEIDPSAVQPQTKPLEYREPCKEPKGREESDLCAQWRAAKAAENSALWTKLSVWITGAGIIGLLITIAQGRIALSRAREANDIARRANLQVRQPYLYPDGAVTHKIKEKLVEFEVRLRNFGGGPTGRINIFSRQYVTDFPNRLIKDYFFQSFDLPECAPGATRRIYLRFWRDSLTTNAKDLSGIRLCIIRLRYSYVDSSNKVIEGRYDYAIEAAEIEVGGSMLLFDMADVVDRRRIFADWQAESPQLFDGDAATNNDTQHREA